MTTPVFYTKFSPNPADIQVLKDLALSQDRPHRLDRQGITIYFDNLVQRQQFVESIHYPQEIK